MRVGGLGLLGRVGGWERTMTVARRWAMVMMVVPGASARIVDWMTASVVLSTLLIACMCGTD